jgi:DNA integrity scanning protein DisA with diadenylate cyclase activity
MIKDEFSVTGEFRKELETEARMVACGNEAQARQMADEGVTVELVTAILEDNKRLASLQTRVLHVSEQIMELVVHLQDRLEQLEGREIGAAVVTAPTKPFRH